MAEPDRIPTPISAEGYAQSYGAEVVAAFGIAAVLGQNGRVNADIAEEAVVGAYNQEMSERLPEEGTIGKIIQAIMSEVEEDGTLADRSPRDAYVEGARMMLRLFTQTIPDYMSDTFKNALLDISEEREPDVAAGLVGHQPEGGYFVGQAHNLDFFLRVQPQSDRTEQPSSA